MVTQRISTRGTKKRFYKSNDELIFVFISYMVRFVLNSLRINYQLGNQGLFFLYWKKIILAFAAKC